MFSSLLYGWYLDVFMVDIESSKRHPRQYQEPIGDTMHTDLAQVIILTCTCLMLAAPFALLVLGVIAATMRSSQISRERGEDDE
jgi:hypothetical protein